MDAHARKTVHELALKFKMKSKSTGKGDKRRPVLHRTLSTVKYTDAAQFESAFARLHRRFFPRLDVKGKGAKTQAAGLGRRSNHAAVTVRDGEIVGGSAPEIAVTNRGRALLEKMGWSSGTALGALDNKGIIQPIEHVVKNSKAGLGGQ